MTVELPSPTSYTPELIRHALEALHAMDRPGYRYKKAGVALARIIYGAVVQPDLSGAFSMFIVNAINRLYVPNTLFLAVQGIAWPWVMRQHRLSGRFTTLWNEILTKRPGGGDTGGAV